MNFEFNVMNNSWDSSGRFGQQSKCKQCINSKNKTMTIAITTLGVAILVCLLGFFVFSETPNLPLNSVKTLKLTNILFRHGARTPTTSYNSDPYKNYNWPGGLGSLTNQGKLQLYKAGQKFRKQYYGFLPEEYSDDDVYVVSSDLSRTLTSAYTLLAGLYPPILKQQWNSHLAWQPIPVHSIPRNLDKLLALKKPCKVADEQYESLKHLPEIVDKYQNLLSNLTVYCNQTMDNVLQVELLFSTLSIQNEFGLTLPSWATEPFLSQMKEGTCASFEMFNYNETLKRLRGGPILLDILTNMKKKHNNELKPDRKMFLYSGHDLTIVALWRILGFEECLLPQYGSSLVLELHYIMESTESEVKLIYYNSSTEGPYPLKIPKCGEPCTLTEFENITSNSIPNDWEEECNGKNTL